MKLLKVKQVEENSKNAKQKILKVMIVHISEKDVKGERDAEIPKTLILLNANIWPS